MSRRWIVLVIVLLVATPSALYARWIKDKVDLETQDVGRVQFSHYNHLEAGGKNCVACHNAIYHIVTKNNPAFTMKQMEAGKACGACHNGKKAFSVKGNCDTCHVGGDIAIDSAIGEVPFSHKVHTAAFGCDTCHPAPFKAKNGANPKVSMKQMEQGESCGACHDGSSAFSVKESCGTCHITKELTIDTPTGGTPFSHKVHTAAFGCEACHPAPFKAKSGANTATMKQMEQGASCGACHDGSTAFSVKANCGTCHTARDITIDSTAGEIPFSHQVHTAAFGCDACHPAPFTGSKGASQATMKQMEQGASCGACHDGSSAFTVKENCGTCHPTREITLDSTVGKVAFSHQVHTAAFGCDACHPAPFKAQKGANTATMKQMEKGASCGACHDGGSAFSVKENCDSCHVTSEIVFSTDAGKAKFSHKAHTGAFGCDACHPVPFKAQKGANTATMKQMEQGASCGACHDGSTAFSVKGFCADCHIK